VKIVAYVRPEVTFTNRKTLIKSLMNPLCIKVLVATLFLEPIFLTLLFSLKLWSFKKEKLFHNKKIELPVSLKLYTEKI
jgi:hypothetical protein